MNTLSIITQQRTTISENQWNEIRKMAEINRIINKIADLLELAPELNSTDTFDFIISLTERELKRRKVK